jgi:hypothetical protein
MALVRIVVLIQVSELFAAAEPRSPVEIRSLSGTSLSFPDVS